MQCDSISQFGAVVMYERCLSNVDMRRMLSAIEIVLRRFSVFSCAISESQRIVTLNS